jgi:hypothetical protein
LPFNNRNAESFDVTKCELPGHKNKRREKNDGPPPTE